jgi:mannose-6-phosphate isomerase-like protein (cupin superfamily)
MRIFAASAMIAMLSSSALAQQPATPPSAADRASYMSAADLAAALAKLPTDRPSSNTRVFSLGPYNVNVERRNPVAQGAATHDAVAELFHVLDGSGTIVTGGTIPNATRNGTTLQGKTIEGGTRQTLNKGDWVLVPSGVPHQFADIKGNLTIMSLYLPNAK